MVWHVFTLHTRGLKLYTLSNWISIRYPSLLKLGVKIYFIFTFMSLFSKNKKNKITEKTQTNKIKEEGFCRETRCVSKQDQMDKPIHLVHHFSISLASFCQSLISLSISLIPSSQNPFQIHNFRFPFGFLEKQTWRKWVWPGL